MKAGVQAVLERCGEELSFFKERVDATCISRAEATLARTSRI